MRPMPPAKSIDGGVAVPFWIVWWIYWIEPSVVLPSRMKRLKTRPSGEYTFGMLSARDVMVIFVLKPAKHWELTLTPLALPTSGTAQRDLIRASPFGHSPACVEPGEKGAQSRA